MIDLVISRFPKEISNHIYKIIEKDLEKKEKSFLIVPEQYTLQSDVDFIDNIKFNTVMDAKVLSFNSLSRFIVDKIGKSSNESLTNTGKIMLLTKILADINDELELFKNAYSNIEFVEDISILISNIKDYNFDGDFFKAIEESQTDQILKIKFREIKKIFDFYQKETSGVYEDSEDKLNYVISRLKECDFLQNTNFYFDKFDSMSELRLDFISGLLKLGCKVTIGLTFEGKYFSNPLENDLMIYDEARKFYRRLKEIDQINIVDIDQPSIKSPDIKHLMDNFEKYNPNIYSEIPENISILQSISTVSEVENLALMIRKAVLKGKRYKDFSLVMTDTKQYQNLLIRIFDRYEIPYFLDETKKMNKNHLIKTWMSLLRIALYNFKKEDLNYFIRSQIFDFGENSQEKIIAFQNYIEKRKIKSSMFFEDKYFSLDSEFYKDRLDLLEEKSKELKDVNIIRNKILDLVKPLYELRKGEFSAKYIATRIFESIDNEAFKIGIDKYQEVLDENGKLANYEENAQMWDKFINILEQLVAILKDSKISFSKVFKLIESAIKNINVGIIPPSKDHLVVTDFSRDRVTHTKYKIILGMNDVFFPSNTKNEFLINKIEKDKLKDNNIDLKVYENSKEDRQLLNLYRMISSSEKIYFSYALSNKSNSEINKSISLIDIEKIFPKLEIIDLAVIDYSDMKFSKDMLTKLSMEYLWKIIRKEKISKESKMIAKAFIEYSKKSDDFLVLKNGLFYSNDKKSLEVNVSKNLYEKNRWNVSEMETYSKCSYKYYMAYGIKPQEAEKFDIDYLEIGNIVHSNIENLSKKIAKLDINKLDENFLERLVKEDFEKSISNNLDFLRKEDDKNKFILKNILDNTQTNSKEIIKQLNQGDFQIDAVEEKFAKNGSYPEVYVDSENYLEGRIDRVDRFKDYIRIIDYKTGNKEIKLVNILNGLDLQLVVYMISTKQKRNGKKIEDLKPVGAFYIPLKDELKSLDQSYTRELISSYFEDKFKMQGLLVKLNQEVLNLLDKDFDGKKSSVFKIKSKSENVFSPEESLLLEEFVRNLIANNIKAIKAGDITLNPIKYNETSYECANCPFSGICKIDYTIDQRRFRQLDKDRKIDDLKGKDNE